MAAVRRRRGRSLTDYFVAFVGLALIAFVVALIATSGSCRIGISPDVGVQPNRPQPTPRGTP